MTGNFRPPGRGDTAEHTQINATTVQGTRLPEQQSDNVELETLNITAYPGNFRRGRGEIGDVRTVETVNCDNP